MRKNVNEQIGQISGTETNPFRRYVGKINLDDFIFVLEQERKKSKLNGYSNLELIIKEDGGILDIYLYGDRDLNDDEKDMNERILVIARVLDKTSKGLTRDELLKNV